MRPFVVFALFIASASASYGGSHSPPQFQPMMGYGHSQQAPPAQQSYGGYQQQAPAAPVASYGQSHDSGMYNSAPVRSAPAPAPETVRISYSTSGGAQRAESSSYGSAVSSDSGYGQSLVKTSSGYGQSHDSGMYNSGSVRTAPAPAPETVRISYSTSSGAQRDASSSYGSSAVSSDSGYGQSHQPSYAAPVRSAPVETVKVSYGSGSNDMGGSSYGGSYSAPAAPAAPSSNYGSGYTSSSSSSTRFAPILRHNQEINAGNSHNFDFATGDGFTHSERTSVRGGSYKGYGTDESNAEVAKEGSYSYTSPEGQKIALTYQADSQGFRAQGDHLPTPPPIPAEIAKSLRGGGY